LQELFFAARSPVARQTVVREKILAVEDASDSGLQIGLTIVWTTIPPNALAKGSLNSFIIDPILDENRRIEHTKRAQNG
jgi:hypothetical protein